MHFHQIIHKYLLEYREKYNSNFNFLVRQRTKVNDKKYPGGKFAHGLVFQGTEKYCFIALSDKNGGVNATKSIGIVIHPTKNNGFKAMLEIVFPGETDLKLVTFYKDLASKFIDINWDSKGERAHLQIGEFPANDPTILYKWLDIHFPVIRETALKTGIEKLIPNDERFYTLQKKLETKLLEASKQINYWIFQGNTNIYNITNALKSGHLKSWKVAAHKDKIKERDKVILWQTGNDSGCYALAEVTSEVGVFEEETFETQYYTNSEKNKATERVKIKVIKSLVDDPLLWKDIKDNPAFSEFNAGNQGTNFSAIKEEYETLLQLSLEDNESAYFDIKNNFPKDKFEQFILLLRKFISINNLTYDDIRISFNVKKSKNRLVFIIGSRYAFMIEGKGENTFFSFVSDKILCDKFEQYKDRNGNLEETYWNSINDIISLNIEVLDGCKIELHRDNKSPHRKFNNIDFVNDVFNLSLKHNNEADGTNNNLNKMATNQILYGPPGTGKTYYLKDQLFDKYTLRQTSISKEQHFEIVVSGCSWWQVIAIALFDLKKAKVTNIFEHAWVQKKASLSNSKTVRPTLWGQLQSHTINECKFVNVSSRQQPLLFNKTEDSYWEVLEEEVKELVPELYDLKDSVDNYNPDPDKIIKNYDFVTFHQSFAYEDFIEGIKPILPEIDSEDNTDLGYRIEDGVFKTLCVKAKNDPENRYAIFIDEINRGNVSAIFGELITLIEIDKRKDAKNEMSIKLPYSKKEFSVPSNIDIYGTMNTADRSVEALDTALRRRFEFKEMMPDYNVIKEEVVGDIKLSEVLKTINNRIELLIDRDHTIGHSYFVNVNTRKKLAKALNNKIVPLLQEYFYGDYGKIGLVLGSGFVHKIKNDKINFANFAYENSDDFKIVSYTLKPVNDETVIDAVLELLGTKETSEEN